MSPAEKAKKLYLRYYGIPLYIKTVKECCHILINEMLEEFPSQCPEGSYEMERHLYWQEVKQEIDKL